MLDQKWCPLNVQRHLKNFIRDRKKFSLWAIPIVQSRCALPFLSNAYFGKQHSSRPLMLHISNTIAYQNFVTLKVYISDAPTCMSQIDSINKTVFFWVIIYNHCHQVTAHSQLNILLLLLLLLFSKVMFHPIACHKGPESE
jgi:hypothetical protein